MTLNLVLKFLLSLDTSKSTGLDDINQKLLKAAAPIINTQLTSILNNCSISKEIFPIQLKKARVTPIFQKK